MNHTQNSENNTIKDTNKRPMTDTELKYADDLTVLREYQRFIGTRQGEAPLSVLYARHERLFRYISKHLLRRRYHVGSQEDCMSIIYISAQIAYSRFNEQRLGKKAKLSTFLYKTVMLEMLTQADKEAFVRCPSQLRDFRTYLMGGYDGDPVKKSDFEKKHGLTDDDARERKYEELKALMPKFLLSSQQPSGFYSYDGDSGEANDYAELAADRAQFSQNGLSMYSDIENIKSKMNEAQKAVFEYIYEKQYSKRETAKILDFTETKVIIAHRGIERLLLKYRKEILEAV